VAQNINRRATNDRIIWIDCEMTGLSLTNDALIEVAALVTDYELNQLGDGIDLVIKPPTEALEQMDDFVRDMHTSSGLLDELATGITMAEAEEQVLAYVASGRPSPQRHPWAATQSEQTAGSWPVTCPSSSPTSTIGSSTSPRSRSWLFGGSRERSSTPEEGRRPPRTGRHPREHSRTPLLPGGNLRAAARSGLRDRKAIAARYKVQPTVS